MQAEVNVRVFCEGKVSRNCERFTDNYVYDFFLTDTMTKIKNKMKKQLRQQDSWKITKEGKCYCTYCARELKLRGTKKWDT